MGTRYQILRRLGSGGMAEVFLAKAVGDGGFEKLVALKQVRPALAQNAESRELFLREARLGARLDHPNLVHTFDGGLEGDQLFLVQELVDGTDLRAACDRVLAGAERLSPAAVAYIGAKVCQALTYVFSVRDEQGRPLVQAHRDVSLGNVLCSRAGSVKLSDFGVARLGESHTAAGIVRGKWEYFPPELVKGIVDGRGDLFALGIVLYELVALHHPFAAASPEGHFDKARTLDPERPEGMPDGLWDIVARALQRDVTKRFQSAEEMGEALESFIFTLGQRMSDSVLAKELAALMPPPLNTSPDPELNSRPSLQLARESKPPPSRPPDTVRDTAPPASAPSAAPPAQPALEESSTWQPLPGPAMSLDGRLTGAARPAPQAASGPRLGETVLPSAEHGTPNEQRPLAQVTHLDLASPVVPRAEPPPVTGVRVDGPVAPMERPPRSRVAPALIGLAVLGVVGTLAVTVATKGTKPLEQALQAARSGAAPQQIALVNVESKPGGAEVYSGEELLGTTPLVIQNDYAPGSQVLLKLKKAGYAPAELSFPGGASVTVSATLHRR